MRSVQFPTSARYVGALARRPFLRQLAERIPSRRAAFPILSRIEIVLSSDPVPPLPADAVDRAAATLGTDIPGLASQLGLAVGAVRHWKLHGMPPYAKLAIAALVTGLDPDPVLAGLAPRRRAVKDEDA